MNNLISCDKRKKMSLDVMAQMFVETKYRGSLDLEQNGRVIIISILIGVIT